MIKRCIDILRFVPIGKAKYLCKDNDYFCFLKINLDFSPKILKIRVCTYKRRLGINIRNYALAFKNLYLRCSATNTLRSAKGFKPRNVV